MKIENTLVIIKKHSITCVHWIYHIALSHLQVAKTRRNN